MAKQESMMSFQRERPLIHVVDDDEAVRSSLRLLGEARGWRVEVFSSADEYLAACSRSRIRPGCLVLDLQMPGMSGAELLERLKQTGKTVNTVVLTARPESELARRVSEAGVQCILSKPLVPEDWLDAVERSLPPE